jgi:RsiW-degrading membrane proteinase PrsW (M82 family)
MADGFAPEVRTFRPDSNQSVFVVVTAGFDSVFVSTAFESLFDSLFESDFVSVLPSDDFESADPLSCLPSFLTTGAFEEPFA